MSDTKASAMICMFLLAVGGMIWLLLPGEPEVKDYDPEPNNSAWTTDVYWHGEDKTYTACAATLSIDILDPNCLTDASIRRLAASGRLCAVLGHQWQETGEVSYYLTHPVSVGTWYKCSLCGETEERCTGGPGAEILLKWHVEDELEGLDTTKIYVETPCDIAELTDVVED